MPKRTDKNNLDDFVTLDKENKCYFRLLKDIFIDVNDLLEKTYNELLLTKGCGKEIVGIFIEAMHNLGYKNWLAVEFIKYYPDRAARVLQNSVNNKEIEPVGILDIEEIFNEIQNSNSIKQSGKTRLINVLNYLKIKNSEDLINKKFLDLSRQKGMGRKLLICLIEIIHKLGFKNWLKSDLIRLKQKKWSLL